MLGSSSSFPGKFPFMEYLMVIACVRVRLDSNLGPMMKMQEDLM